MRSRRSLPTTRPSTSPRGWRGGRRRISTRSSRKRWRTRSSAMPERVAPSRSRYGQLRRARRRAPRARPARHARQSAGRPRVLTRAGARRRQPWRGDPARDGPRGAAADAGGRAARRRGRERPRGQWAPRDRAPARRPAREARAARVAGRGRRARAGARLPLTPFLRPPTGTQLASARGLAADDKQVSGEPQQRRRALDGAGGPEEALALDGIGPSRLEVGQEPARALDADEVERHERRLAHLGFELVRQMEVRSGEVVPLGRVRVAAVLQVALDDRDERRVTEESLEHAGEERDR